jgi:hypothetical protein
MQPTLHGTAYLFPFFWVAAGVGTSRLPIFSNALLHLPLALVPIRMCFSPFPWFLLIECVASLFFQL